VRLNVIKHEGRKAVAGNALLTLRGQTADQAALGLIGGPTGVPMKDIEAVIAKAKAERRRYRRVRVDLKGRLFVPADSRECHCNVIDLSPGGASLDCELALESGTQIVLYLDGFGRLEGNVVRAASGDFGVRFNCTPAKRERLAEQLTLFINHGMVDVGELRRHDRTPTKGIARFTRADGQFVACEVLDLSVSGVSLKTDVRPPIGEFVLIGQMAGRVARHHEQGIGIEFVGGTAASADRLQPRSALAR